MAMTAQSGWRGLFWTAFKRSRNAMMLLDDHRRHVEVNGAYLRWLGYRRSSLVGYPVNEVIVGGSLASTREWQELMAVSPFTGIAELVASDGHHITVQYAAQPEVVTGKRLILFVALQTVRGARRLRDELAETAGPQALTERELEIVRMIALGSSGPEIAEELHLSHHTVRTHIRNAMIKLGVRTRAQLVARSLGEGIVLPDPSSASATEG
jgi:PAS domain S-box-containing protein